MIRNYKLAANFNTVEFEITEDDILAAAHECEVTQTNNGEYVLTEYNVSEEELIKRILQKEYDILASIRVVNIAPDIKQAKQINPPSEKQAAWAEALGMKDAMKHDKREVWTYIQKHKDD